MNKNRLKFLVDVLMFIDICSISFIGFLMAFVIPKGEQRRIGEKFFMGMHRHDWGDIHLYLSLFLLALLFLHIYLNWNWIVTLSKQHFDKNWRVVLCILPIAGILLIAIFRLLVIM